MLRLDKISKHAPYSKEWFDNRLGKMTGSRISCLMGQDGLGVGGMTYIRNKVSEVITGESSERSVNNEATQFGIENEPLALKYFQKVKEIPMIIVDKHIIHDERYSVTPDGLIVSNDKLPMSADEKYLNCEVLESKSYMTPSIHMQHVECTNPLEIKMINKDLYWQLVAQMIFADVIQGHAIFFHPKFPESSKYRLGHVVFNKMEMRTDPKLVKLKDDFKIFNERIELARNIFNQKIEFSKNK